VFVQVAPETGVLQAAFVHRTCRGQGAGGVRFWRYATVGDFLRDGLRLARGMTLKNALAGLWWGGGKGVMAKGTGTSEGASADRRRIYEEYGDFITSIQGCYVTAEDVGTSVEDMAAVFSRTRFTTCIPPALGGSGNPSVPTARGVVRGMEAALAHLGLGTLEGKTVAVQGLGHVGEPLVRFLLEKGVARILGSDIDPARQLPGVEVRIVYSVYNLSLSVLDEARRTGRTPARVALDLAERRSREIHPVWGHRGAEIIRSLVRNGWAQ
jgi:glutamate dehydrogenase (NAD(P)+)